MTPIGIVINSGVTYQKCYSMDYNRISFIYELVNKVDKIAIVFRRDFDSYYILNFSKMHKEMNTRFTSWRDLENYIDAQDEDFLEMYSTDVIVPQYMQVNDSISIVCPFSSFINNQLNIVSFENGKHGKAELCDIGDPYIRDTHRSFSRYEDIVFSGVYSVNLDNTLPIVCGCACEPRVWTNPVTNKKEMFALQAGRLSAYAKWNQKNTKTAFHYLIPGTDNVPTFDYYSGKEPAVNGSYSYNLGIIFIDFSPIGSIDVIDYKDCRNYKVTKINSTQVYYPRTNLVRGSDHFEFYPHEWKRGNIEIKDRTAYKISFLLPKSKTSGVPIVSICGKLFLYNQNMLMRKTSEGIFIELTIQKDLLERIILSNFQHYGKHIDGTTNVQTMIDIVLDNLFNQTQVGYGTGEDYDRVNYSDFLKPFVVMVNTDKQMHITKIRPKMTIFPDKVVFPKGAGGLLVNKNTMEIVDYVRVQYNNDTLATYTLQCPLNMFLDIDTCRIPNNQMGYESYFCPNEPRFLKMSQFTKSLRDPSAFELIDISYTNKQ